VGYVRKNEASGEYECTMKVPRIAAAILGRVDLKRVAEPFMQAVAASTQETVHLSILDDIDVFYVHKIDSAHPVRAYSEISGRAPAYCVATGKALLAFQDDAYLQRFGEAAQGPHAAHHRDPGGAAPGARAGAPAGLRHSIAASGARPWAASPRRSSTLRAARSPPSASPGRWSGCARRT
jgi:DNA-binding IclR family transcriptional regulator